MDVVAEMETLKGAMARYQIYTRHAISIYHHPEHLWRALNFVKENFKNYKFYKTTPGLHMRCITAQD